jgi:hypothetical protein
MFDAANGACTACPIDSVVAESLDACVPCAAPLIPYHDTASKTTICIKSCADHFGAESAMSTLDFGCSCGVRAEDKGYYPDCSCIEENGWVTEGDGAGCYCPSGQFVEGKCLKEEKLVCELETQVRAILPGPEYGAWYEHCEVCPEGSVFSKEHRKCMCLSDHTVFIGFTRPDPSSPYYHYEWELCPYPSCNDRVQNYQETGIDCGGICGECPTCDDGKHNGDEEAIDCGGSCAACTSCGDGVMNGDEAGIDCGGSCSPCPTCSDGQVNGDETGTDCGGSCSPCPTCNDGQQNGYETGTDCGGPDCPACPTCDDGEANGDETGIDCGGSCSPCATCNDGVHNGDEEDVDCGGLNCPACPTCSDFRHNGDEEGVDCGGSCNACPTCNDGLRNGDEEGVDCGGYCSACSEPATLNFHLNCTDTAFTVRTKVLEVLNNTFDIGDVTFSKDVLFMEGHPKYIFSEFHRTERYLNKIFNRRDENPVPSVWTDTVLVHFNKANGPLPRLNDQFIGVILGSKDNGQEVAFFETAANGAVYTTYSGPDAPWGQTFGEQCKVDPMQFNVVLNKNIEPFLQMLLFPHCKVFNTRFDTNTSVLAPADRTVTTTKEINLYEDWSTGRCIPTPKCFDDADLPDTTTCGSCSGHVAFRVDVEFDGGPYDQSNVLVVRSDYKYDAICVPAE